jgi:hypothetical protein
MTNSPFDLSTFDFSLDPSFQKMTGGEPESIDDVMGADPGVFLPNLEGRSEFLPPEADKVPRIPNAMEQDSSAYAKRPASDRIRELLAYMNPHRQVLLGVMRAAKEPKSNDEIKNEVDALRTNKFSVYSSANICNMLEQAGALDKVTATGEPYKSFKPQAKIVVIDGEEFWEPTEPPQVYWRLTSAGQEAVDNNDPLDRITRQLQREEEFRSIYHRVLKHTSTTDGATMAELSAAVDEDPLISNPRRFFVQHFVEALERCECISWEGRSWKTTPLGKTIYEEHFSDIVDDYVEPEKAPGVDGLMITETQGVRW